jgi:hypothetical protein
MRKLTFAFVVSATCVARTAAPEFEAVADWLKA